MVPALPAGAGGFRRRGCGGERTGPPTDTETDRGRSWSVEVEQQRHRDGEGELQRADCRLQNVQGGMMRILYAVTVAGSAYNLLRGQLGWLRVRGHDVHLACAPGPELAAVAAREGVPVHPLPLVREPSWGRDLPALLAAVRLVRRLRPDVVFAATTKAGLVLMTAARLCRVRRRIRAVWGLRHETLHGRRRSVVRLAERASCRFANTVVAISPSIAARLQAESIAPSDRIVTPGPGTCNGVDARRFARIPERAAAGRALRRELGVPAGGLVIGFVGRLVRDKGIAELLSAFRRLRPRFDGLRLLLVGGFETGDALAASVRAELARDPGIILAGRVADPVRFYHAMDVLCLPSRREGFPNVPLEAAAAELPVVTTDATGACDSVAAGVTGLVVPVGDVAALTEALARLAAFPGLRRQM
ncbi:MAG TPA: glycosyltransferase family 1 protein, partial [candidate division WOR-3 bacterium]|nr:glycosyltransferase family 1 protein [candidate division WOR-3 bacterium]